MKQHAVNISLLLASGLFLYAQDPETPPIPDAPQTPAAQAPLAGPGAGRGAADPEPRPYDRVITKDAKTSKGVFTVHQIKSRFYYEIPAAQLGKDFLLVSQIARTTIGAGYGGQFIGSHVVRW